MGSLNGLSGLSGIDGLTGEGVALWWDPLGEGLPVVGAYRAIASVGSPWPLAPAVYADTLQNWANPGTNDLVEGNGVVPWAAATGWGFVSAQGKYFLTALIPANDQSWSILGQFANYAAGHYLVGSRSAGGQFVLLPSLGGVNSQYRNGGNLSVAPGFANGNIGIGGNRGYRNGVQEAGVIGAWTGVSNQDIYIGARNNLGAPDGYPTMDIHAVVMYSGTLTAPQILAVATAMAAL